MKIKHLILGVVAAAMSLAACTKEQEQPAASMTLSPESVQLGSSDNLTATVTVKSNRDWKIADVPEWLSMSVNGKDVKDQVFPASDSPVSVAITALANTGMQRSAEISFNGGTLAKKSLSVTQEGKKITYTSLADVRKMIGSASSVTIADGTIVKAYVISGDLDNLTSQKSAYIQDETAGINLYCAANHSLKFGDEVSIDLSGATLKVYAVSLEIDGLALDKITTLSSGNTVEAKTVSLADFIANEYESQYVALENVQVTDADLKKTWVMGGNHTSINMIAKTGETFVVRSSKYSSFGEETVAQGSGTIKGIATVYNDGIQLVFAQKTDWAGLTGDRFEVETPKIESEKISIIKQASQGGTVILKNATVVATSLTGQDGTTEAKTNFLVTDSGREDHILIFSADISGLKIGDNVNIEGTLSSYSSTLQITGATVTVNSHGTFTQPTPRDITEEFDNFASTANDYISFKGTYVVSEDGKYHNINVLGASSKIGSVLTPDGIDISQYEGVPNVTFTGYYLYTTSGKYIYIMLTDVQKSEEPYIAVTPNEVSAKAEDTSATFEITSNVSWTCESQTEGFTVDTASGEGDATVTVSFSKNEDTENARTATVKVSSSAGEKTVTIVQAKKTDISGTKYVKVAEDPSDWSGNYLIVWGTEAHATLSGKDLAKTADVQISETGEIAFNDALKAATVIIEKTEGGYSVKLPSGKYLSCKTNSNQCSEETNPFTFDSITVANGISGKDSKDNTRYLYFNTGNKVYRFYVKKDDPEGYVVPTLYKLVK